MGLFFDSYFGIIEKIEKQYHTPTSLEFRQRDFSNVSWSEPKHRNFFTIIKILAEKGASTVNEIVESDGYSLKFKDKKSRYITYRRIILGDKRTQVTGLIEKGIIILAKSENKLHKRYELSHHGIMYAIKLFMDIEIVNSGNYKNMLSMDRKVGGYNYSTQTEFPETIIDILAKNYSHVLSLIFGKWDYLKKNPRINPYRLYEISILKRGTNSLMNHYISSNCTHSLEIGSHDGDIALEFFTRQIEQAYYPLEYFLKAIDDKEITEFIDIIFYSYERLYRESYYRSQGQYWLYKGDKEKSRKFFIKSVNCNELISLKEKEKYKKSKPGDRQDFGIRFCK